MNLKSFQSHYFGHGAHQIPSVMDLHVSLNVRLGRGAGGMVATDATGPALHHPHHIQNHLMVKQGAYLLFVIFFTRTKFLENKIYTEKRQFFAFYL